MAENTANTDGKTEAERQAEFLKTQKYLLENWAGTTTDPKTGKVLERRIVANGRPFMSNDKGFGYV